MKQVAIIGGGAAAAAVVGEILRQQRTRDIAIHWFAGHGARGRGIAYSAQADHHVLNVRAAGMGLFADDGGAFFRHVGARAPQAKASDFLPRAWFGDFVEATLAPLVEAARERGQRVQVHASTATAVRGNDTSGYRVTDEYGLEVAVDEVVLAIGALPSSALDEAGARALASGRYIVDAWQALSLREAPRQIVVIGTGLTAVDVVLQATSDWPSAHITAVSRHGHLPAAHLREPGSPYDHQDELIGEMIAEPRVRRWSHVLREAAADPAVDWRSIVDGLRPVTGALWQALPIAERARFLRHLRAFWEPARHRLPPQTAATIDALRTDGRLDILAARIDRIDGDGPLELHLRERGHDGERTLAADLVVQATGPRLDASATRDPLVVQMLADGLVRADAVGLGLAAESDGRLHSADGTPARRLRVLGALMRGSVWECAAFAEIRALARTLATDIVSDGSAPRVARPTPLTGLSRSAVALVG